MNAIKNSNLKNHLNLKYDFVRPYSPQTTQLLKEMQVAKPHFKQIETFILYVSLSALKICKYIIDCLLKPLLVISNQ